MSVGSICGMVGGGWIMEEYGSVFLFRASAVMVTFALGVYAYVQWHLGNLTERPGSTEGGGQGEGEGREGGLEGVVVDVEGKKDGVEGAGVGEGVEGGGVDVEGKKDGVEGGVVEGGGQPGDVGVCSGRDAPAKA